jgi:hypothetical protein
MSGSFTAGCGSVTCANETALASPPPVPLLFVGRLPSAYTTSPFMAGYTGFGAMCTSGEVVTRLRLDASSASGGMWWTFLRIDACTDGATYGEREQ